jgi:hypothetical protein
VQFERRAHHPANTDFRSWERLAFVTDLTDRDGRYGQ